MFNELLERCLSEAKKPEKSFIWADYFFSRKVNSKTKTEEEVIEVSGEVKKYYYHVARKNMGSSVQLSPQNPWTENEPNTPRICVADTIAGCLVAIGPDVETEEVKRYVYVYKTRDKVKATPPRGVADAKVTGEMWLLKPTVFDHSSKIKIADLPAGLFDLKTGFGDEESLYSYKKVKDTIRQVVTGEWLPGEKQRVQQQIKRKEEKEKESWKFVKGYMILDDEKIKVLKKESESVIFFELRKSGSDGIHFVDYENIYNKGPTPSMIKRLKDGKKSVLWYVKEGVE